MSHIRDIHSKDRLPDRLEIIIVPYEGWFRFRPTSTGDQIREILRGRAVREYEKEIKQMQANIHVGQQQSRLEHQRIKNELRRQIEWVNTGQRTEKGRPIFKPRKKG